MAEEQKKKLEAARAVAKQMRTVILDGDEETAYFVARGDLDIADTVIAVPFPKLIILLGQLCTAVIAPLLAGRKVMQRSGGEEKPSSNDLTS